MSVRSVAKPLILLLVCLLMPTRPAVGAVPAEWAPQDTLFLIEMRSYVDFKAQFEKTSLYKMYKDERANKALSEITKGLESALDEYAKRMGLDSGKQLKIEPQGGAALIILPNVSEEDGTPSEPSIVVAADWGNNSGKLRELLDTVTSKAIEKGGKKRVEEFKGVNITDLELPAPDPASNTEESDDFQQGMNPMDQLDVQQIISDALAELPAPERVVYATLDSITIFGSDVDSVKAVVRQIKGDRSKSLSNSDDYLAIKRHCSPTGEFNVFINLPKIISLGATSDDEKNTTKALGFDSVRALVGTIAIAPKSGAMFEGRGFLPVVGERRGVIKMLTENVVNKPVMSTPNLPQDTLLAAWSHFRFNTLMDEIFEIQKQLDPEGAEMWKASMKIPVSETETIDLYETFRNLSDPFVGHLAIGSPYEKENVSAVISIGHKNREAIGDLFQVVGPYLQKRDFLGQSLYDVMFPIGASLSLTDTVFAVGNTAGVEQMIRGAAEQGGAQLSGDAQFRKTARLAPKDAWMVYYQNETKIFDVAKALKKKADDKAAAGETQAPFIGYDIALNILNSMQNSPMVQNADVDVMRQYTGSAIVTAGSEPKGIRFYMGVVQYQQP